MFPFQSRRTNRSANSLFRMWLLSLIPQTLAPKTLNKNNTAIKKLNSSQITANNSSLIQIFYHNTSTSLPHKGDLTNEQNKSNSSK
jgi:hypothetical protein